MFEKGWVIFDVPTMTTSRLSVVESHSGVGQDERGLPSFVAKLLGHGGIAPHQFQQLQKSAAQWDTRPLVGSTHGEQGFRKC